MVARPLAFQVDGGADVYGVKLEVFEGPLDLLLFLIRKNEVDIYDIPIAEITRHYLGYVELMRQLDLEQAGDFVLMAATLMKIKSQMLLPSVAEDEELAEDPREELVRRLLEYQEYKEIATWMEGQQESSRNLFYRGTSLHLEEDGRLAEDLSEGLRPVGLFDLLTAFRRAIDASPKDGVHEIERLEVTAEERAEYLLGLLSDRRQIPFSDVVSDQPKIVLVVTFVAMLELVRTGQIIVRQSQSGGDIWIFRREGEVAAEDGVAPAPGTERDA